MRKVLSRLFLLTFKKLTNSCNFLVNNQRQFLNVLEFYSTIELLIKNDFGMHTMYTPSYIEQFRFHYVDITYLNVKA